MSGYLEVLADWLGEFYHDDEEPADEECNDIRERLDEQAVERLDEQAVSYFLRFTEAKFDETRMPADNSDITKAS